MLGPPTARLSLSIGLTLVLLVVLVRTTLLDPQTYERSLEQVDAYERVYREVLFDPELAPLKEDLLGRIAPGDTDLAELRVVSTNVLRWTVPPSRLEAAVGVFLERLLAYLRGETPLLDGNIGVVDLLTLLDEAAVLETRLLLGEAAADVAGSAVDYEASLVRFAESLAAGRVPAQVPVYGDLQFDPDVELELILQLLDDRIDDRTTTRLRAALASDDQREALIAAASVWVAEHAAELSEQLRNESVPTGQIDVVAGVADRAGTTPADVVAELNTVRTIVRWLSWPTGIAGVVLSALGVVAIGRRHRHRPAAVALDVSMVLAATAALFGLVCVGGAALVDSPLEAAIGSAPDGWALPRSLQVLAADIEASLADELRRTVLQLMLAPLASGALLAATSLISSAGLASPTPIGFGRFAGAGLGALTVAAALMVVADARSEIRDRRCNGLVELCRRPYDEVVHAATHNAMSSPDVVFAWPQHDIDLRTQLDSGIRALLIDVHHWEPLVSDEELARLYPQLRPDHAARLRETLEPVRHGRDGTYLCHVHCAFGAVRLTDALRQVGSFLDDNPHEVVTLLIEDHVSYEEVADGFARADLERHLYAHRDPNGRWPTLGELIDADERLLVFAENVTPAAGSGDEGEAPAWYHRAFDHIQDTPFGTRDPERFSCRPNRGGDDAPLFLMNHWVYSPTPDRVDAATVNQRPLIVDRARTCAVVRGQLPNFIAVDFSTLGDVVGAVRQLNEEENEARVETRRR